jgi:DNA-binding transcriptional ArsR family regulator
MHHDDESSHAPPVLAARPSLMRALNEQMLLEQIRRFDRVSRSDLTAVSGLSKPTVAAALATLENEGLIQVAGRISGRRGARSHAVPTSSRGGLHPRARRRARVCSRRYRRSHG